MEVKEKKKTKRKQAHQNTYAFRHNPNSMLTKEIAAIKIFGLCRRCNEKIEWRKKYRKYKIQTHVSRCTVCLNKSITTAYNIVCEPCGEGKKICRICRVGLCFETCAPLEQVLEKKKESATTSTPESNNIDLEVNVSCDEENAVSTDQSEIDTDQSELEQETL
ncbi:hypothetical protein NEIG_00305 [Nematocida sp. ERTm5]|nr:hypothetical protein NEIRO02_2204 [Nematocida sp. AWRm79]KAI5183170.1 hypothetical protein NEIRO03_0792 [Nematocida sp. AWRm78]OAG30821.1 hypothetical protein NEIG_00305 [Nematocida sp. ERTm5]